MVLFIYSRLDRVHLRRYREYSERELIRWLFRLRLYLEQNICPRCRLSHFLVSCLERKYNAHQNNGLDSDHLTAIEWEIFSQSFFVYCNRFLVYLICRPGFTRINLPYFMKKEEALFILESIVSVAEHGWKLLPKVVCPNNVLKMSLLAIIPLL